MRLLLLESLGTGMTEDLFVHLIEITAISGIIILVLSMAIHLGTDLFARIMPNIKNKPKINDIYKVNYVHTRVIDPFETPLPVVIGYAKILEIKDGWVKYRKKAIGADETELIKEFHEEKLSRHATTHTLPWSKFIAEYPHRITGLTREDRLDSI